MVTCNVLSPQIFWWKKARTQPWLLFGICILVNIGMWFERFVIIVTSLHRDFLPASWGFFIPTWVDVLQLVGSFGLFFTLTLIFMRVLPMIAIAEVKPLVASRERERPDESPANNPVACTPGLTGFVVAEFPTVEALTTAVHSLVEAGHSTIDAHSPFPNHHLIEAINPRRSRLPWWTFFGGVLGLIVALVGMYYLSAIEYPLVVGGKKPGSWQGFVPVAFELTVLFASFGTVIGLLYLCRLPRLHHPLFNNTLLARATDDGFLLSVETADPKFSGKTTIDELRRLGATNIEAVEA
jgi:hypothetical protein